MAPGPRGGLSEARSAYRVAHGQGYSVISHRRGDLEVSASWCVDAESSVKQVRLHLVNRGHRTLQLRVVGIAEWMMGANRADRGTVHTALWRQRLPALQASPGTDARAGAPRERRLSALLATQRESSAGFGDGTAFLALAGATDEAEDWTCDRRECFDARGRLVLPDHFGKQQGSGLDPCAALSTRLTLAAGESAERVFLLGYARQPGRGAPARHHGRGGEPAAAAARHVRAHWDELLGASTVQHARPAVRRDGQPLAAVPDRVVPAVGQGRLLPGRRRHRLSRPVAGRDGAGLGRAAMLREQIVLGASRQFAEGDVQHWWHAPAGAGVRTHFSDDLLWLPHACAHYLRATGDASAARRARAVHRRRRRSPTAPRTPTTRPRVSARTAHRCTSMPRAPSTAACASARTACR